MPEVMNGIAQGDRVAIPAGTKVKSLHPQRKEFVTTRRMTVRVNHFLSAQRVGIAYFGREKLGRQYPADEYPQFVELFAQYDALMLDSLTNPDPKVGLASYQKAMEIHLPITKARVCWPGTGGYWNEVDLDIVTKAPSTEKVNGVS